MQHWKNTYPYTPHSVEFDYFTEDAFLYDIETTGLSARHHQIYLIGCAYRSGGKITIHQYFAESPEDESCILREFLRQASAFSSVITFNGKRFDEPFLRERCDKHHIPWEDYPENHLDIYQKCKPFKKLLSLPSLKQKSIEQFLGITRDDRYDGGELIRVYQSYLETRDADALHLLQLHNYEDVAGMITILPIFAYRDLGSLALQIHSIEAHNYSDYEGQPQTELLLEGSLGEALPAPVQLHLLDCYIILNKETFRASIPLFSGTMRHYLPNYKDYVYLPLDDMIVLKELASCIAKDKKQPAKPANCYVKKEGLFLCLPPKLTITEDACVFYPEYKAPLRYLLYDATNMNPIFFEQYLKCLLRHSSDL